MPNHAASSMSPPPQVCVVTAAQRLCTSKETESIIKAWVLAYAHGRKLEMLGRAETHLMFQIERLSIASPQADFYMTLYAALHACAQEEI